MPEPTFTLIASDKAASSDGDSVTLTLNTTGANLVIVGVSRATGAGTPPTLSSSPSNTPGAVGSGSVNGYLGEQLYYYINPTTNVSHSFTASFPGSAPSIRVLAINVSPLVVGVPGCQTGTVGAGTSITSAGLIGYLLVADVATIGTSHTAAAGWSSVATDFVNSRAVGGILAWKFNTRPTSVQAATVNWTGSGNAASSTLALPIQLFTRYQVAPVLANHNQGGANVGGLQPDAWAAPAACWDGSRWVMTASLWNAAGSKWHSAFFTSSDLVTWSYVASSLKSPGGSDTILGNSGLAWFAGKYWWAYTHYNLSTSTHWGVTLAYSTDLVSWTVVADPLIDGSDAGDPALAVNPNTGKLEVWANNGLTSGAKWAESSDGTTWPGSWTVLTGVTASKAGGEPQPFFLSDGTRGLTFDYKPGSHRTIGLSVGASLEDFFPTVLDSDGTSAWEDDSVFDSCVLGAVDRATGAAGDTLWMLHSGSHDPGALEDCIGLAYMDDPTATPAAPPAGGLLLRRRRAALCR